MRYTIPVDTAGGRRGNGKDERDTDCHSVCVMREDYFRKLANGAHQWVRPAVVAAIKPEQRVDIDVLADWVYRLYRYYGSPLVVPEANNERGLIVLLRQRGVHIYEETKPATKKDAAKKTGKLGFWTSGQDGEMTRNWIIENLARVIREISTTGDGIFCPFPWIVSELAAFHLNPDTGKYEAASGFHDDWVLCLAIGYATRGAGTVYQPQTLVQEMPRDLLLGTANDPRGRGPAVHGGGGHHRK